MNNRNGWGRDPMVSIRNFKEDENQMVYQEDFSNDNNEILMAEGGMDVFIRTK